MLSRILARQVAQTASASYKLKVLTPEQLEAYNRDGYILIKDVLPKQYKDNIQKWVKELEDLPETPGKWMKYFELDRVSNSRLLCRIENFLPYFPELDKLANGLIREMSSDCLTDEACLYKDKVNFKFPKGNGFRAHQDQPAFISFGVKKLLTVLLPIDPNTRASGGLDFVTGGHVPREIMPMNSDGSIRTDFEAKMNWTPIDAHPGDVILFDSYSPHRSDINTSNFTRRNFYLTYNTVAEGYLKDEYYRLKRIAFPPEIERDPNVDYSEGAKVFNVANPIK